jgi:hypothetical protein
MVFTPLLHPEDDPPKRGVDKKEERAEKWPQEGGEKGVRGLKEGRAKCR